MPDAQYLDHESRLGRYSPMGGMGRKHWFSSSLSDAQAEEYRYATCTLVASVSVPEGAHWLADLDRSYRPFQRRCLKFCCVLTAPDASDVVKPSGEPIPMDAKYAINLAKTTYREAYRQGDVERLLSVFAADRFTDMSDGLPSKYGQEARTVLQCRAERLFADYIVNLNIIIIDVAIQGDTARDYGWHEWILTPKAGGPVVRKRDRYFELWTHEQDGSWRISLFLNNTDVREQIGPSVSRWFMTEEPAIA
jgi:ketosteroid isomerase-like protein